MTHTEYRALRVTIKTLGILAAVRTYGTLALRCATLENR